MRFLLNWIMTAIALAIAVWFIPGLSAFGAEPWLCFLFVSLSIGIVNSAFVGAIIVSILCAILGVTYNEG